jgi:hypothetical protein
MFGSIDVDISKFESSSLSISTNLEINNFEIYRFRQISTFGNFSFSDFEN